MSYNPFSLEGKTIFVTGASSGIGRATAIACSRMGANVILTGRNMEALMQTLEMCEKNDSNFCLSADLTDENQIKYLVDNLPVIDGLVSNAGTMKLTLVQFVSEAEIERIHRLNLVSPMLLLKYILKSKKLKKGSSVVFTESAAGIYRVSPGNAIYASAKAGLDAFMRTSALELASKNIRVNSVNPGIVETNLINSGQFTAEQKENEIKNYPMGRFAAPEEVANGIVFLLSDAASFITGVSLKIDGGMTLS